jgi:archaellum biogenesis protein FlaJ (TadC family)
MLLNGMIAISAQRKRALKSPPQIVVFFILLPFIMSSNPYTDCMQAAGVIVFLMSVGVHLI